MKQIKMVHVSKNERKREIQDNYKSIAEQHNKMLKGQVEFFCEQVEKLQHLLNREVYRGQNHMVKQIRFY